MFSMVHKNKYQTFWQRLIAIIIDTLVLSPVAIIINTIPIANNKLAFLFVQLATSLSLLIYFVIGHGKYGYSVGKKIMRVKVSALNEKHVIGFRRAFLRESIWFFLSIGLLLYLFFITRNIQIIDKNILHNYTNKCYYISSIWLLIELVTMLATKKKRRALHDFIANSVVIQINIPSPL